MVIQTGMKGAVVTSTDGELVFIPQSDPYTAEDTFVNDEILIVVPLGDEGNFATSCRASAAMQSNDPVIISPLGDEEAFGIPEHCEQMPIQITSGVASTSGHASGEYINIGRHVFFWNGNGAIGLSGSSNSVTDFTVDDCIWVQGPRGYWDRRADPTYTGNIDLSNVQANQGGRLFSPGVNAFTVFIRCWYGDTLGCGPIYLIQV